MWPISTAASHFNVTISLAASLSGRHHAFFFLRGPSPPIGYTVNFLDKGYPECYNSSHNQSLIAFDEGTTELEGILLAVQNPRFCSPEKLWLFILEANGLITTLAITLVNTFQPAYSLSLCACIVNVVIAAPDGAACSSHSSIYAASTTYPHRSHKFFVLMLIP